MSTNDMFSTDYNPVLGTFINGTFVNSLSNFVDNIGGTMDGQVEMILNVPNDGEYILTVTYLAYEKDRMMKLEVNGVDTGNIYVLTQTNSDMPVDAMEFSTTVKLNAGDNIVKIHGNGIDDGPSIGNVNIRQMMTLAETPTLFSAQPTPVFATAPTTLTTNYDAALGTLSNGAYINLETNFVDNIGGQMDGAVEIPLTVESYGDYNLSINYLASYSNANLVLDVNGVTLQNNYFMFQTPGSGVASAQTFSMIVTLQAGSNIIKFHGNGADIGPSVGSFTLNPVETLTAMPVDIPTPVFSAGPTTAVTNYDATLGTFINGAYINSETNFVDNIGGIADGAVEIPLTIDKEGQYNLSINYLAQDDSTTLKVDVNGFDSGNIYYVQATIGSIAQTFNVILNLVAGNNLIKFHGNGMDKGPSIGRFTINSIETIIPTIEDTTTPVFSAGPTTLVTNYDASLGTLLNGASVNAETNFVDNLGGATDGAVEVPLSVDKDGEYNLEFKYIAPFDNTALKLDINDVVSDEVYFIPQTIGSTVESAQVFSTAVTLKAGSNKVKFHGNGTELAPSIGTFTIYPVVVATPVDTPTPVFSAGPSLVTNYDASLGTLLNGASVNVETNFVDNLGGPIDGAVELPLSVDQSGKYNLKFNYLAPLDNTALKLDVNGIDLGDIYFIPQTIGITADTSQAFTLAINLNAGSNMVKFHGNGVDLAPNIGTFTIELVEANTSIIGNTPTPVFSAGPTTLITNYDAALGTLLNGASVNTETSFVDNLGGPIDGAVEVPLSVDQSGEYNLQLNYLSHSDNTALKLDVNGNDSGNIYFIPQTAGETLDYVQSFNVKITLLAGTNKVIFHGNGVDMAPSIGTFNINFVKEVSSEIPVAPTPVFSAGPTTLVTNYDAALGNLYNNALINESTNFVDNLGGAKDGAVEVPLNVDKDGQYNLELKYLAPFDNTILKVDVNDFDSGENYFVAQTAGSTIDYAQSFNVIITLKSGSNKVKFHGNAVDMAPSIGTFVISAMEAVSGDSSVFATSPMDLIRNYDAALGVLSNGAIVDMATNFVDNIGGYLDGSVEVPLTVNKEGQYNLEVRYLSPLNSTSLKVDVNDVDSGDIYFIEQTLGNTLDYASTFNMVITLMVGTNKIKFHGDGMNMSPSIGTFTINPVAPAISDAPSVFATAPDVLVTNYDASLGVLSNGASVNLVTSFVDNLGGTLDGAVEIPLSVDKEGEYNLEIKYLSPNSNTRLKININGIDLGNNYLLVKTTGDTLNDVQLYNVIVTLKAGINVIKFHGNGIEVAPSIGTFIISFMGTTPDKPSSVFATASTTMPAEYDSALGTISGKASINSNTKMLDNIGGSQLGSSTINVNVNNNGNYVLELKYLSPNGTSKLKIDINDIVTNTIYSLGKTNGNTISNVQSFNTTLNLKAGVNKLKFYGDATNNGLSIGKFTIKTSTIVNIQSYNANTGSLVNGAIINATTKFVDNIGGKIEGTAKVPISVNDTGIYSLAINYLCADGNSTMKIIVNDSITVTVPSLIKTIGTFSTSSKIATASIKLNKGSNTIKISGDKLTPAFSIGVFTILLTTIVNEVATGENLYDITTASLANGAFINKTTKFVENIGGKLKGTMEINVDIPKTGPYYVDLNYLSPNGNSSLKIDINNKNTGTIYYMQKTNSNTTSDIKVYNIPLDLLLGKYKIKFYGDGTNIAPNLGNFSIEPITIINMATIPIIPTSVDSKEYYLNKGILSNGAIINKTTNFIENLGGQDDGSVEISTVTIPVDHQYLLAFRYLSPDGNSNLQISVNGEDLEQVYTLGETKSGNIADVELFSIENIYLTKGINKIFFHGDGSTDGPSFEKFILTPIKKDNKSLSSTSSVFSTAPSNSLITNYDVALGTLKNGAVMNDITSFVDNIGGLQDGESEIILTVYDSGEYNLDLNYLSPYENTVLKIMVNGVDLDEDYFIPQTLSNSIEDTKVFNTKIKLTEGKNLLKFHGNKIDNGPSLSTFVISLIDQYNKPTSVFSTSPTINLVTDYDASLGYLSNNASIQSVTNFVYNLGGGNDGTVEVVLSTENSGQYDLNLQYLSPYDNSSLKIDINGFDSNDSYFIPKTIGDTIEYAQMFNEKIDLMSGNNVIKFHGNGIDIAPWIGKFTIKPVNTTNNNLSTTSNSSVFSEGSSQSLITDYEAALGILSNGSIINEETNFVDNLGGPLDGATTVTLIVDKEGVYKLDLAYLSIYGDSVLKFDVNGIDSGKSYFISKTNEYDPENLNVFNGLINLLAGQNTIKFHGNGINLAPSVGPFIITLSMESYTINDMSYLSTSEKKN